jgi:hypothetical protein
MRTELDRALRRDRIAELTEARDQAHAQMMAAWSYWIEAKASFSIAAGELALAEYRDPS